jgi:DNA-binding MarR family transcriptional regulator
MGGPTETEPAVPAEPVIPLSADEEAFVRAFGRAMTVVPRVLDVELQRAEGIAASEYSALMHLSEAPDRRMRMSELAFACSLSVSGMTRIVSRLETDGLVKRERCDSDGRGWNAVLTDAGLARLERAWPAHLTSVRQHMIDHLDGIDLPKVTAALEKFGSGTPCGDAIDACEQSLPTKTED